MAKGKKISYRQRQKKRQKIFFIVLTAILSVGLLGSSVVWFGGSYLAALSERSQSPAQGPSIADLEARAKEKPDDPQVLAALARAYFDAGRLQEAEDTYAKAVEKSPEDGGLRRELAMTSFLAGNYDRAAAALEEELKRNPEDKEALYLYGQVLALGKNDYKRGIEQLEKFIALQKTGDDVVRAQQMIAEWRKYL
ncbi:MAG: tetratricopeptide repeat protein [Desulfotomaculales bacterium]